MPSTPLASTVADVKDALSLETMERLDGELREFIAEELYEKAERKYEAMREQKLLDDNTWIYLNLK